METLDFFINEELEKIEIAPIYDYASCLYPQLSDNKISEIINYENEIAAGIYVYPTSALKINDKKIISKRYEVILKRNYDILVKKSSQNNDQFFSIDQLMSNQCQIIA